MLNVGVEMPLTRQCSVVKGSLAGSSLLKKRQKLTKKFLLMSWRTSTRLIARHIDNVGRLRMRLNECGYGLLVVGPDVV